MERIAYVPISTVLGVVVATLFAGTDRTAADGASPTAGTERVVPLMSAPLTDLPHRTLTAVVVHYAPGGVSRAHRHSGSVFAYVADGAIESQNSATGAKHVYRNGEAFFEPVGSTHLISRNASAVRAATLLAVFIAPSGDVLTRPADSR